MSENAKELILEASRGQAQFAYFQLGLAASAIAFAVHETDGKALVDTPWLLGVAVLFWAISFASGCFGITARHQGLVTNAQYLIATSGANPLFVAADPELAQVMETAKDKTHAAVNKPFRRFGWQLWMLFVGAIAYVGGHVAQMAATPSPRLAAQAVQKGAPEPTMLTRKKGQPTLRK